MPLRGIHLLESKAGWDGSRRFDLETSRAIMAELGNPQDQTPAIHVAGTNGKGTVSALLASIFNSAGKRVALFTSPHLHSITERCLIDGLPIEAEIFDEAIDIAAAAAQAAGCEPSFFELVIAASFVAARTVQADLMVVEAGLGGRLDATNTIHRPLASVITTVGFDHMNVLGETIEQIAFEKAGIIKTGAPVICGDLPAAAQSVIDTAVKNCPGAGPVYAWGRDFSPVRGADFKLLSVQCGDVAVNLDRATLRFRAEYQQHNLCVAAAAAIVCGADREAISSGICRTRWPGRVEMIQAALKGRPLQLLLDVAHNRDGIAALFRYIEIELGDKTRYILIISILDRKEWRLMLNLIRQWMDRSRKTVDLVFTRSEDPRAVAPEELQKEFAAGEVIADPYQALERAAEARCAFAGLACHRHRLVVFDRDAP